MISGMRVVASALLGLVGLGALAGCSGSEEPARPDSGRAPNLVVVMTDDQTAASFTPHVMPFTSRLFAERGTVFGQAFATPPLCCPARVSFLTGQYPAANGVDANDPGYGDMRDPQSALPGWLRRAGYRTGFVGKFMNGYPGHSGAAPGWDSWSAMVGDTTYHDFELSIDGKIRRYGSRPADYATRVLTRRAVRFARDSIARERPFFLWLSYNAPHLAPGSDPACDGNLAKPPGDGVYRRFAREELPRPPSFNEADVRDKPGFLRRLPPISEPEVEEMTRRWRCALASLYGVDRGIRRFVRALERTGAIDDTVLVFLSDNGYFFGEHRKTGNKRLPHAAAAQIPLAISVPDALSGGERPASVDEPVGIVDLAPTLLDYAGAEPCRDEGDCRELDGRTLRGLLEGDEAGWPQGRALLFELDDGFTYSAIRTSRYLYVEYRGGYGGEFRRPQVELYDLRSDPHQLENLWRTDRARVGDLGRRLAARLERLRS